MWTIGLAFSYGLPFLKRSKALVAKLSRQMRAFRHNRNEGWYDT